MVSLTFAVPVHCRRESGYGAIHAPLRLKSAPISKSTPAAAAGSDLPVFPSELDFQARRQREVGLADGFRDLVGVAVDFPAGGAVVVVQQVGGG